MGWVPGGGGGSGSGSCYLWLGLSEDTARILLLAALLLAYMAAGAALFQALEWEAEVAACSRYREAYVRFLEDHWNSTEVGALEELLYAYGNATQAGLHRHTPAWDFIGSFHFVATIVSTIGYGNTAPQTSAGRAAVIGYGFLGCSGGILFFNLFLERIITMLAWVLRTVHLRKLRAKGEEPDEDDSLDDWKPSVYWVMLCLLVASLSVALTASAVYAPFEGWSFLDAVYFCFVSFATIGFGDLVATQGPDYPHSPYYRLGNFVFLVLGCSCIYSLFNVTSIIIKQGLNWVLGKLDCRCCGAARMKAGRAIRRQSLRIQQSRLRRRSSAVLARHHFTRSRGGAAAVAPSEDSESESGRRLSGELISMKDLLSSNKVSLAVMQKQLYEMSLLRAGGCLPEESPGGFTPGAVGPLAILSKKLEPSDPCR